MRGLFVLLGLIGFCIALQAAEVALPKAAQPALNGIEIPLAYKNWKLISISQRTDKNSLRAILGNSIAINAIQQNRIPPWPDGAIIAKLVWKQKPDNNWSEANVPGAFEHAEFMLKDSRKYASTAGWGFARWLGTQQTPYGIDAHFDQECLACHTKVKGKDFVFTDPVVLP
jgi:Cytochrome P460